MTFGGVAATNVTVVDDNTITATTPAHSLGIVPVSVTAPDGTDTLPTAFTYGIALNELSSKHGGVSGGQTVHLYGAGLSDTSSVTFGDNAATHIHVIDDTDVTVTVPAHAAATVDVTVTSPSGTASLTGSDGYTYGISIDDIYPNRGGQIGGTVVLLHGYGLTGTSSVTFDGSPGTSITIEDDERATVTVPPHALGSVDVVVTSPSGTYTATDGFTYGTFLESVAQDAGSTQGGTAVEIYGSGLTGTSAVTFGGIPATSVHPVSDTRVTAVTPAHALGNVDVTITSADGTDTAVDGYHYGTQIDGADPNTGDTTGGTAINLYGGDFTGTTAVTIGGRAVPGAISVVDDSHITVTTPPGTAGDADIVVTAPEGVATLHDGFTYALAAPVVTTGTATSVGETSATLHATVNANGGTTSALTIKYSTSSAAIDAGNGTAADVSPTSATGTSDTAITASVTGLSPTTTYYYRASATNAAATADGATGSFTTSSDAPALLGQTPAKNCVVAPGSISKARKVRTIQKANCKTNASQAISVSARKIGGGGSVKLKMNKKSHVWELTTVGSNKAKPRVQIIWSAQPKTGFLGYELKRTYN